MSKQQVVPHNWFFFIGAGGQFRSMWPIVSYLIHVASRLPNPEDHWGIGGIVTHISDTTTIEGIPKYTDDDLPALVAPNHYFLNAIGQVPRRENIRKQMFEKLQQLGAQISPLQSVHSTVYGTINDGVVVHHGAFINTGAMIGFGSIINTGAIIEHDAIIGQHCHICPGAIVLGGIHVGDDIIVGAGSVVVNHLREPGMYAGCPARKIALPGDPQIIVPGRRN